MKSHERICLARKLNHLSQEEMAEKLNISPSGYARIERGEVRISIERLEQISQILNVDLYELLPGKDDYGMTIKITENDNSSISDINLYSHDGSSEIMKLKLMLKHKDELLEQKNQELEMIKQMFELLRKQIKGS